MSEELKPCPFCGGDGSILDNPYGSVTGSDWQVGCSIIDCHLSDLIYSENKKDAIKAWNTRTAEPVDNEEALQALDFIRQYRFMSETAQCIHDDKVLSAINTIRKALTGGSNED